MKNQSFVIGAGCALLAALAGCAGDESGPASHKVSEIEISRELTGTTNVERHIYEYDGSRVTGVRYLVNGQDAGRREFNWSSGEVTQINIFDADGDRATEEWIYRDGRMAQFTFAVPSAYTDSSVVSYDQGTDRLKEIASTTTPASGGEGQNRYIRFEYDGERLVALTEIRDTATETVELRYDNTDRLERLISYRDGRHLDTVEYRYDGDDNRLAELMDGENNRATIQYDGDGRIERVQQFLAGGGTITVRYQYEGGDMHGLSIAPTISPFFDLSGASQSQLHLEHVSLGEPPDFPTPSGGGGGGGDDDDDSGDDGGGGGDGSENTCDERYPPQDPCEECANDYCCDELLYCADNQNCIDYFTCINGCSSDDGTCYDTCASSYPQGYNLANGYWSCAQSYCSAQCGF